MTSSYEVVRSRVTIETARRRVTGIITRPALPKGAVHPRLSDHLNDIGRDRPSQFVCITDATLIEIPHGETRRVASIMLNKRHIESIIEEEEGGAAQGS